MNAFENAKTRKLFIKILDSLSYSEAKMFTEIVKNRFWEKNESEEELDSYKITESDLMDLLDKYKKRK